MRSCNAKQIRVKAAANGFDIGRAIIEACVELQRAHLFKQPKKVIH